MYWIGDLMNQVEKFDIISFDIFDTLVKRDCQNPRDIFEIVENKYNSQYKEAINFAEERYSAELKLYQRTKTPTLEEIYDELPFEREIKEILCDLEKNVEIEYSCKNQIIFEVYEKCLDLNKEIYAISDMYLPCRTIRKILEKCGYNISNIYISAENAATKGSGELFKIFLKKQNINSKKVLHIGDNYKSDIKGAKKAEICSFHIPKEILNTTYYKASQNQSWEQKYLYPFVNNHISFITNRRSQIGFETLGPMVFGFCQWLHTQKEKNNINKLLFCARDVCQTMHIYKMLYPQDANNIAYLCVSLKSLKLPYEAACGKNNSQEAKEQLELLRDYLNELGCSGSIAMVDSGCGGHTQHMLTVILGNKCKLHGFYMRISKNFRKNVQDEISCPYMFTQKPSAKSYITGAFLKQCYRQLTEDKLV